MDLRPVQPDIDHPNLILVECSDIGDIEELAKVMRIAAAKAGGISVTEEEAKEYKLDAPAYLMAKSKGISTNLLEDGLLRFMSFKGSRPINVVLTLEENEKSKWWQLSMSHATLKGPDRVSDEIANVIVEAFFEYEFKERPPGLVFKAVRYFQKFIK